MSKFCISCGSENSEEYFFCKNCGKRLTGEGGEERQAAEPEFLNSGDSVSGRERAAFIGKNAYKIMRRFSGMHLSASKISWCWPVAVLSFFFGLFGAAIWFFYRKMYRAATLLTVLAVLLTAANSALNYNGIKIAVNCYTELFEIISADAAGGEIGREMQLNRITEEMAEKIAEDKGVQLSSILQDLEYYGSIIILGMFAYSIYRKHSTDKILRLRENAGDRGDYLSVLSSSGGTSSGMAFLGVAIMVVSKTLIMCVPAVLYAVKLLSGAPNPIL